MKLNIQIDKLTPCLEEVATGEIFQTTFSVAEPYEVKGLHKKGWYFDWADSSLDYCTIYKLQLKDDDMIQGLVATEVVRGAVFVHLAEAAPHPLIISHTTKSIKEWADISPLSQLNCLRQWDLAVISILKLKIRNWLTITRNHSERNIYW
jgi:hypothetical protein